MMMTTTKRKMEKTRRKMKNKSANQLSSSHPLYVYGIETAAITITCNT